MSERLSVPFDFVATLAAEFGAVECCWRESDRSFTGFVAEVWFESLPISICCSFEFLFYKNLKTETLAF